MSTLNSVSQFFYGHTIDQSNNKVDFDEGAGELTAIIPVGDYTLEEFASEIASQMTDEGTLDYTAAVDRATGKITLSAGANFELLVLTGSNIGETAYDLAGFTGSDRSGDDSYEGDLRSGFVYVVQYPLFSYISFEDWKVQESSVVNASASGVIQAVSFGDGQRMQGNLRIITNRTGLRCMENFRESATGKAEALAFLTYAITKSKMEFMEDESAPNVFSSVILESAPGFKDGTGFTLKNMGVPDFYETGVLQFRKAVG